MSDEPTKVDFEAADECILHDCLAESHRRALLAGVISQRMEPERKRHKNAMAVVREVATHTCHTVTTLLGKECVCYCCSARELLKAEP